MNTNELPVLLPQPMIHPALHVDRERAVAGVCGAVTQRGQRQAKMAPEAIPSMMSATIVRLYARNPMACRIKE